MSGYEKTKFENLVRVYREGVGEIQELNATVRALHDRVEELESQNVELLKRLKSAGTYYGELDNRIKALEAK